METVCVIALFVPGMAMFLARFGICVLASFLGIVRSMIETLTCEQRIRTLTSLTANKRLVEFKEYEYRCCELR